MRTLQHWDRQSGKLRAGDARTVCEEIMRLRDPFKISARLMPALQIGGAWVSLDLSGLTTSSGRDIYECYIDLPDGSEHEITDLRSGCQGGSVIEGFGALLSFLGAAAESRRYRESTGREGENEEDLFPPAIVTWATEHDDEISMLSCEIEETPNLIEEDAKATIDMLVG